MEVGAAEQDSWEEDGKMSEGQLGTLRQDQTRLDLQ